MSKIINNVIELIKEYNKNEKKYVRYLDKKCKEMDDFFRDGGTNEGWQSFLVETKCEENKKAYDDKSYELCTKVRQEWAKIFDKSESKLTLGEKWICKHLRKEAYLSEIVDYIEMDYAIFEVKYSRYEDEPDKLTLKAVAHGIIELFKYLGKHRLAKKPTTLKIVVEGEEIWEA